MITDTSCVAFDIKRFSDLFWKPGDVRELRIPKHNKYGNTASGYFDSPDALVGAAANWDGTANIYFMLAVSMNGTHF